MVQCACTSVGRRFELNALVTYVQSQFGCNCSHVLLLLTKHVISSRNLFIIEVLWEERSATNSFFFVAWKGKTLLIKSVPC
jgi:hypothetical protein